jgi:hypothetical protein
MTQRIKQHFEAILRRVVLVRPKLRAVEMFHDELQRPLNYRVIKQLLSGLLKLYYIIILYHIYARYLQLYT